MFYLLELGNFRETNFNETDFSDCDDSEKLDIFRFVLGNHHSRIFKNFDKFYIFIVQFVLKCKSNFIKLH